MIRIGDRVFKDPDEEGIDIGEQLKRKRELEIATEDSLAKKYPSRTLTRGSYLDEDIWGDEAIWPSIEPEDHLFRDELVDKRNEIARLTGRYEEIDHGHEERKENLRKHAAEAHGLG